MTGFGVILQDLPAAKRAAKEIADRAIWPPPRRRLAVWVAFIGIPMVGVVGALTVAVSRAAARSVRAPAFGDGRGLDPTRRAAIGILHLHPTWLARDH